MIGIKEMIGCRVDIYSFISVELMNILVDVLFALSINMLLTRLNEFVIRIRNKSL